VLAAVDIVAARSADADEVSESAESRWSYVQASAYTRTPGFLSSRSVDDLWITPVWLVYDEVDGGYEVLPVNHGLYQWPMAIWALGGREHMPSDWLSGGGRSRIPVKPPSIIWQQRGAWIEAWHSDSIFHRRFNDFPAADYSFPRYVKVLVGRDIAAFGTEGLRGDRRDLLPHLWCDMDLMSGEWVECRAEDPIYDSTLAANPTLGGDGL
jgi:hypothetical protein